MNFIIKQEDFFDSINRVQRAVSKKNTLPVLNGVFMEADRNKGLHLMATDLELGIENWLEANIIEEGKIVLPASQLTSIVRELPPAEISFNVDQENYSAHIECLNSEFDIRGLNPEEFPSLPEVELKKEITISRDVLKEMIDEVKFTTAREETQPSLTGALMLVSGNIIKFVATNTYRLAYSQREIEAVSEEDISIIIPGDSLNELSHLLEGEGEVNIRLDKSHVCFQFADIVLISRLIEGDFPNYEHVMPDKYNTKVEVDKAEFHQAVKRASLVAREDSNVLQLEIDNDIMIINTLESEAGKAHEELEITMEGDSQRININAGYLLDVFRVLKKDTLDLELIDNINPLSIRRVKGKEVYIYLIMPIRQEDERGSQ